MTEDELLRCYFDRWIEATRRRRESGKRMQIANFLQRLIKEKERLSDKNESTRRTTTKNRNNGDCPEPGESGRNYLHRYRAQKHIIALQKAKLEEQKRHIEELKLNKIMKEVGSSSDAVKEAKTTLTYCSVRVKPKMKIVLGELSPSESTSNESLKLTCVKVPRFYQEMEARARERQEKRAMVMERRRQIELEREKLKEQIELERQFLQQEELDRRMNEFKERRRQEQLVAIRRKQYREKMRALFVMADLHYEKILHRKYGPSAWRTFLDRIREDRLKAEQFDRMRIMRLHFENWNRVTRCIVNDRIQKADNLYHTKLKLWAFDFWMQMHKGMRHKYQTAEDWYELTLTDTFFAKWKRTVECIQNTRKKQWNIAIEHYNSQLKWKVMGCWETLPTIQLLERKQEARKQRWRLKVQQVLPDYIPKNYY